MLLQTGKAQSPEGVEVAKLQGLGIADILLDSPAQWTNLWYGGGPPDQSCPSVCCSTVYASVVPTSWLNFRTRKAAVLHDMASPYYHLSTTTLELHTLCWSDQRHPMRLCVPKCSWPCVNAVAAIRYLDLSGNRLTNLAGLTPLPVLHTLLLSGNCISGLAGCGTAAFLCLEVLDVSFNGLQPQSIQQLGLLPQLRQLDVSGADAMSYPYSHIAHAWC